MLVTTTPNVEGSAIATYHGVVTGETIVGVNAIKDLFSSVTDVFGGRSTGYEEELGKARETALSEMQARAQEMGANAVIGVDLDYEVLGSGGSMLMVSATGTAVTLER